MDWRELIRENALGLGVVGVGVLMVMVGIWQAVATPPATQEELPLIGHEEGLEETGDFGVVIVELAGAVEKPGVYELESGKRLYDLLEQAGGMTQEADHEWVAKTLNQAERLKDGQKVYIPSRQEGSEAIENHKEPVTIRDEGEVSGSKIINVNTATQAELEDLWGIGEARAKDIIENRPYASLEELQTKAKVPANVIERNEGKMSIY